MGNIKDHKAIELIEELENRGFNLEIHGVTVENIEISIKWECPFCNKENEMITDEMQRQGSNTWNCDCDDCGETSVLNFNPSMI